MRSLVALGLATVLAATGCSSGSSGGGEGSKKSSGPITLNVSLGPNGQFTKNFNPYGSGAAGAVYGMIFEPLYFFNQAKANDEQPVLATKYEWSPDGKTLTFTLREGVKWSDGQPFTSEDVRWTFDTITKNEKINWFGLKFTSITAPDPKTVVMTLDKPNYASLWYIAGRIFILPKHQWEKAGAPDTFLNENPVGTGPYQLKSFTPQAYVLAKNPTYWEAGKPQIDEFRYVAHESNTSATNALLGGQLDWAGLFVADIDKTYAARDKNNKYGKDQVFITQLTPNTTKAPLNDVALRRAISLGIDREAINKTHYQGRNLMPSVAGVLLPRDNAWLPPELADKKATLDPAGAEKALQDGGWTKGADGIYAKGGQRAAFKLQVVGSYTDQVGATQMIKEQLKAVGIEVTPQPLSAQAYDANRGNGDFEMTINNMTTGPIPYYGYFDQLASKNFAKKPATGSYARYGNKAVDEALVTIDATNDEAQRKAAYATIANAYVNDQPYIPLMQEVSTPEYRDDKVTGWPTPENPYALLAPYFGPDMGIIAKNLRPV